MAESREKVAFFSFLFLQKINLVYYIEEIDRETVFFTFLTRRYTHCTIYCIYRGTSGLLWDSERPSILVNCRVPMSIG